MPTLTLCTVLNSLYSFGRTKRTMSFGRCPACGRTCYLNCAEGKTNPFLSARALHHGLPYESNYPEFDLAQEQQGNFIIAQHFQRRGRIGRLMLAVAYNPYLIGLGIDEDTAVIINPKHQLEVVGRGSVIVVDGVGMTFTNLDQVQRHEPVAITEVRVHVLTEGFGYDLVSRKLKSPNSLQGE